MGISELAALIGKNGLMSIDGFSVPITISDARKRYGNTDVQVTPIGGSGVKWVQADRVTVQDAVNV